MDLSMKQRLQKLCWDALLVAGAAIFVYGLWLAWHPLGFIIGGLLIAGVAIFCAYDVERRRQN